MSGKSISISLTDGFTDMRRKLPRMKFAAGDLATAPSQLPLAGPMATMHYREQDLALVISPEGWDLIAAKMREIQKGEESLLAEAKAIADKHNTLAKRYNELWAEAKRVEAIANSLHRENQQLESLCRSLRDRIETLKAALPAESQTIIVPPSTVVIEQPKPMEREIIRDAQGEIVRLIDRPREDLAKPPEVITGET